MPTPDLIQQQRKLLHDFRQAQTEYVTRKNTITEHFNKEQEAASLAFNQARQKPDEQIGNARGALDEARSILIKGNWLSDTQNRWPKPNEQSDNPVDELSKYTTEAVEILRKLQLHFVRNGVVLRARSYSETVTASAVVSLLGGVTVGGLGVGILRTDIVFLPMFVIVTIGFFFPLYQILTDRGKTPVLYTALLRLVSNSAFAHQCLIKQLQATYQHQLTKSQTYHDQKISSLAQLFQSKLEQIYEAFVTFNLHARPISPSWIESVWNVWTPDQAVSTISRFGELNIVGVTQLGSVTRDLSSLANLTGLVQLLNSYLGNQYLDSIPALLHLPNERIAIFKTVNPSKSKAASTIRSILLRLLATISPGKLRFTFIDPVGLGQNVAPFMHLADYDEQIVTSKAWTEPQHIEQRLTDLTEHMENVIQKYLRNQFATIEEYNAQAGEVAEPYRVLAVFDFPANFSETAARRLVSIAQNGPRCGVYTVVLVDMEKPLPYGFNLADLEQNATVIVWDSQRWVWQDEDFKDCLLELDEPPPSELFNRIVTAVGEAAKGASKVEVPFARIAPPTSAQWTGETGSGLSVALGPSGARKLQLLELGKGTAQHVLVAGKTGSGKSTLLHTLITNLALHYSPDQLQFYLIDFKKGVEFKTYATHALPHACVIAIESEREFGLSVLQGLDVELKRRGDLFRAAGVDDLAAYRRKQSQTVLPRILLLVDEFQEFFTDDDPIATQSAQLLDRLVRQGRAFGIHVLLGSQTLAGAYTLARSTIDQMAVRIALQCSEADSRLILSDDNPAARLLARPGEAIYNAANGRIEGNNPFQVAYLTDEERDRYLAQIHTLAQQHSYRPQQPLLVFEGNAPGEITKNQTLAELLNSPSPKQPEGRGRGVRAWLGDPIAIRESVAATFRKQSGSNLLVVGQSEETAIGMFVASLLSLAAQAPTRGATIYLLDFGAADDTHADYFTQMSELFPHMFKLGRRRQLPDFLSTLAAEVQQRLNNEGVPHPPVFLFVHGLQRARDLRPDDNVGFGYSFSSEPQPPSLPQQFATILRDGPDVSIHTVVWCDTMSNLDRTLDRRSLREFSLRVAMQMSEQDSSLLLDTPAANRLGLHRAFFYREDEGRLEKFRPYGLPARDWLEAVSKQLNMK